ncbi:hypothetical protein HanRHA438_Chr00c41g0857001 [Helianthus annuus]|nr:hypothetical protein HanRHA438_Chr00c41g0857001 [Helianthus annuus]
MPNLCLIIYSKRYKMVRVETVRNGTRRNSSIRNGRDELGTEPVPDRKYRYRKSPKVRTAPVPKMSKFGTESVPKMYPVW